MKLGIKFPFLYLNLKTKRGIYLFRKRVVCLEGGGFRGPAATRKGELLTPL